MDGYDQEDWDRLARAVQRRAEIELQYQAQVEHARQRMQAQALFQQYRQEFGGQPHGQHWRADPAFHGSAPQGADPGAITWATEAFLAQQTFLANAQQAIYEATALPLKPLENTGIEVGEVIAWRAWGISGGFLKSLFVQRHWAPGQVMTGQPQDYGTEGVHAFKTAAKTIDEYGRGRLVIGRVALWGKIIEHKDGYRAENARPISLDYIIPDTWRMRWKLRRLRQRYGLEQPTP